MHKHLEAGQVILHVAFLSFNLELSAGKKHKQITQKCVHR